MDEAARARILNLPVEVLSDGRAAGRTDPIPGPAAEACADASASAAGTSEEGADLAADESDGPPSDMVGGDAIVRECAGLDQSDTDNGRRLIAHFGADLAVVARSGMAGGDYLAWEGRYWDFDEGPALAMKAAQKIGGRIAAEAEYLAATPEEMRIIRAAEAFAGDDSETAKDARASAKMARAALKGRKLARWRFAVSSKNLARLKSMIETAAPHLRKASAAFNRDPLRFAARNATLRFVVEQDFDCPDPDVTRFAAHCEAREGHDRDDYLTGLVAADFDPDAAAPKWRAFLDRCLPDGEVQRTLKAYAAMGLLGTLAQKVMFHYGSGANGKSVFLAVLGGVIGPSLGVALPKETILGTGERGAGQASPDLVRLFGKRFVRIDELKAGETVREDLVKRLTGGDVLVVRDLFKGYLEFPNVATPHMIGNDYPKIEGTDNGIWRRMLVLRWGVTIPEPERRPFDEMVSDLLSERSGILNWLIDGACDVLANGLVVADACLLATEEFREDMDPIGRFVAACVRPELSGRVQARALYESYKSWAAANAVSPVFETRFGREMKKRFPRDERSGTRAYLGIELHDVPARPDAMAEERGSAE